MYITMYACVMCVHVHGGQKRTLRVFCRTLSCSFEAESDHEPELQPSSYLCPPLPWAYSPLGAVSCSIGAEIWTQDLTLQALLISEPYDLLFFESVCFLLYANYWNLQLEIFVTSFQMLLLSLLVN